MSDSIHSLLFPELIGEVALRSIPPTLLSLTRVDHRFKSIIFNSNFLVNYCKGNQEWLHKFLCCLAYEGECSLFRYLIENRLAVSHDWELLVERRTIKKAYDVAIRNNKTATAACLMQCMGESWYGYPRD